MFKNLFSQNTPEIGHNISVALTFLLTVAGGLGTACVAQPQVFGPATHTVLAIMVGIGTVGAAIKLGIGAIGGNVNPNNITASTAQATIDPSKPTK